MTEQMFYGWFDDAAQPINHPTFDPPHDAPCPFCGSRIIPNNVRTHSLMYRGEYAARSYFYRTHRSCAENDPSDIAMDGFILDMIKRNGDRSDAGIVVPEDGLPSRMAVFSAFGNAIVPQVAAEFIRATNMI